MIHEVKIPTGCKASVSVDSEKIVVLIDPVEDFVTIDEEYKKAKVLADLDKIYESEVLSASPKLTYLCDEDNRIMSNVSPGMVVKSETGHIAIVGRSDYTVVLTPDKEIQLNQTCNFPFEYHATKEESEELFEQLKIQKALYVFPTGQIVSWSPTLNEQYEVVNSYCKPSKFVFGENDSESELWDIGNVFPVGFITEERQQQLKETLKNLVDS